MASEIERKFLVSTPVAWRGEELGASSVHIDQGYLTPPGAKVEIRLRRAREVTRKSADSPVPASKTGPHGVNRVWKMTIKGPREDSVAGLVREEVEIDLDQAEFERLWPLTKDRRIRKVRTSCSLRTGTSEMLVACLDDFRDKLEGLDMVEVEFESEQEAEAFVPPSFFGTEVTGDPRYRNAELAGADGPPSREPDR
ncbi:MAG TPA: CYTH domain-containing protein [Solirubrobacterales bacterium]|nr:CYTH domain-containing protein [Solirubrobacterales bacterium]